MMEAARLIPKGIFDKLSRVGWNLERARLLDVGAGQGGAMLEALLRGADAYGIEPGNEFRVLAQMRLREAGNDPCRISAASAEALPFSDNSFDYVMSLQVLEHVPDPRPLIQEMFRVLKPNGQCYISCENYLSFQEQHYRVLWLPMLPKIAGAAYLRAIGRNPAFLREYIYYSTYPQIWRLARQIGFKNLTHETTLNRLDAPSSLLSSPIRALATMAQVLPTPVRHWLVSGLLHLKAFWRVGVEVRLSKPGDA
jgi:ubiquinone/menaquinone biosynthesis C-methylase UbiE